MPDPVLWLLYFLSVLVAAALIAAVVTGWFRREKPAPAEEAPFTPLYPPFDPDAEVVEGHVVDEDELGVWEPTAHELLPASIADRLLEERAWPNLRTPSWSAWTGAHPVVRLSDLAEFGAVTA